MQLVQLKTQQIRGRAARFRLQVILVTILVNILGCALVTRMLWQNKQHQMERVETSANNIAAQLKQNITKSLGIIETNLLTAKVEIERQQANGSIDDAMLNTFLKRLQTRFPEISDIRIVDANGIITHSSANAPVSRTHAGDLESSRFLRDHPLTGLLISKPLPASASGGRVIVLSRRLNHSDGSFAGVLNGTISLNHFQKLFSASGIGPNDVVSLRNDDMEIAAYPQPQKMEHGITSKAPFPKWQEFLHSGRENWLTTIQSPDDNETRMVAAQKVANSPLYVIVGLSLDDYYFVNWWQAVETGVESLLLFTLMTVLISLFIYYHRLDHLLSAAKKCSIRTRPCRTGGFANRMNMPVFSRIQSMRHPNLSSQPQISYARCSRRSVSV